MRPIVFVLLVAAVLGSGLAVAACGSSAAPEEGAYSVLQESLGPLYLSSYKDCAQREAERRVSLSQLEDVAELPQSRQLQAAADLLEPVLRDCKRADPRIYDPNATSQELAEVKLGVASSVAKGMLEAGATPVQAACVERRFRQLTNSRFLQTYGNASTRGQEKQTESFILRCRR
ncbi:MAG TPA: hypothetical protein VF081_04775 [Solirubrobacterales bacterium]